VESVAEKGDVSIFSASIQSLMPIRYSRRVV